MLLLGLIVTCSQRTQVCTFQAVAHTLTFRELASTVALAQQQLQHSLGSWGFPHPFHGELAIVISDLATLDWAWDLRMLLETASTDASLVVGVHDMNEEAVLARYTLGRLELPHVVRRKAGGGLC